MTDHIMWLKRRAEFGDGGVFGTLVLDGYIKEGEIWTVERGWKSNRPSISCIPEGVYVLKPQRYNRGRYDAIEVCNVPDRSAILFHKANWAGELQGCIAPGLSIQKITGKMAVSSSSYAFGELMAACTSIWANPRDEIYLHIFSSNLTYRQPQQEGE